MLVSNKLSLQAKTGWRLTHQRPPTVSATAEPSSFGAFAHVHLLPAADLNVHELSHVHAQERQNLLATLVGLPASRKVPMPRIFRARAPAVHKSTSHLWHVVPAPAGFVVVVVHVVSTRACGSGIVSISLESLGLLREPVGSLGQASLFQSASVRATSPLLGALLLAFLPPLGTLDLASLGVGSSICNMCRA